jgi:hypothetical protein
MFREMFSVFVAAATGDEDIYHNGSSVFSGNALSAEVADVGAGHRRMYSGMQALQSLGRVAVRWLAAFVMRNDERPHPGAPCRRGVHLEDTTHHNASRKHVEVLVVPRPEGRLTEARLRISTP